MTRLKIVGLANLVACLDCLLFCWLNLHMMMTNSRYSKLNLIGATITALCAVPTAYTAFQALRTRK